MLSSIKFYVIMVLFCVITCFGLVLNQKMHAANLEEPSAKTADAIVSTTAPDLELISRIINRPWGIDVDGDVAAVLSTSEFALMDVKNPTIPRIVDYIAMNGTASENRHQGQLKDVLLKDTYAYVIWSCSLEFGATSCEGGGRLEIIDIGDVTAPKVVGSLETDLRIFNITILDSMVYLSMDQEKLAIVDISDPTTPHMRSITSLANTSFSYQHPVKAFNNNNKVYVYTVKSDNDYNLGLVILDVTNPDKPTQISVFDPGDIYVTDLDFLDTGSNQYVYLMDSEIGLRVIDVTDPTNPNQVDVYDFGVTTSSGLTSFPFSISGEYIYVPIVLSKLGDPKELHILDISNPTIVALAKIHDTPYLAETTDITASNSHLYITDFKGGTQILDITDPVNPVETGSQAIIEGFTFSDIAVDGSFLYIAGPDALYVYDAFNPLDPQETSRFETSFYASGVIVNNGTALVVDRKDGMIILDVTDPTLPTQIGITNESLPAAENMVLKGTLGEPAYAFVGNSCNMYVCPSSKLNVIDLSTLSSPTITKVSSADRPISAMSLSDDYLYTVTDYLNESDFMIWDVSNPLTPDLITDLSLGVQGAQAMTVIDNYAYIATAWTTPTLQTWDVIDPENPVWVNTLYTDGDYTDLSVDQEYLYATTQNDQLLIFDRSDAEKLMLIDETALPVELVNYNQFNEIAVQGDFVYVLREGLSIWHHKNESLGQTRDAWNRPFSNAIVNANTNPMAATGLTGSFAPDENLSGTYELSAELSGFSSWPPVRTIDFDEPVTTDENFYMLGEPVEAQVSPAAAKTLIYADTLGLTTEIFMPVGAISAPVTFQYQPTMAFSHGDQSFVGNAFKLSPQSESHMPLDAASYVFNKPVEVTIHYSELGTKVVDESTLQLMVFKEGAWVDVIDACAGDLDSYVRDEIRNIIQVSVCQTGEFALFGDTEFVFLPVIRR